MTVLSYERILLYVFMQVLGFCQNDIYSHLFYSLFKKVIVVLQVTVVVLNVNWVSTIRYVNLFYSFTNFLVLHNILFLSGNLLYFTFTIEPFFFWRFIQMSFFEVEGILYFWKYFFNSCYLLTFFLFDKCHLS